MVALFILVILLKARSAAPVDANRPRIPFREKLKTVVDLAPTAILILVVLGTIYGGLATATESAALGVVGAIIFAAIEGKLSFRMLNASAEATARNTAMIGAILFGAYVLNYVFVGLGVPQQLAKLVAAMPLPPWGVMLLIIGFYLALGTFMEGFSMVITTLPVVYPVMLSLGYDPIWFGVIGAMIFAAIEGKLTFRMLNASAEATARNTALIGLILFGAYVLNFIFVGLGVPQALATLVAAMPLPPWGIMLLIIGFYLALGTFMEGFSMVVTTIPVVFPVVLALGYDPIWFGVIVTMLVEIALISPPDGTVLYVLQGMRRDGGPITDIFSGVMPFMFAYILALLVLMGFPDIALWLPRVMK